MSLRPTTTPLAALAAALVLALGLLAGEAQAQTTRGCEDELDCGPNENCNDGTCLPDTSCLGDGDCGGETPVCYFGECVPGCGSDDDCESGECQDGACVPVGTTSGEGRGVRSCSLAGPGDDPTGAAGGAALLLVALAALLKRKPA